MKNSTVTPFVRDEIFYFILGRQRYLDRDYLSALKYLTWAKKVLKNGDKALKYGDDLVIGDVYSKLGDYDLSNYHYFSALSAQFLSQPAYRGLGENFLALGDETLARYYLELCQKINHDNPHAMLASQILAELDSSYNVNKRAFTVIQGGKSPKISNEIAINIIDELMEEEEYNDVIELCKQQNNFADNSMRSAIVNSYIATEQYNNAQEILTQFSKNTIDDIGNQLLLSKTINDNGNFNIAMQKLKEYSPKDEEECFKLGVTLASYNEELKAIPYLERYFSAAEYNYDLQLLFAKVCMSAKCYEKARQKLVELKTYNPFQNYILNKYINICVNQKDYKLETLYGYSTKEINDIKAQIKKYLLLDDNSLKKEFVENEDFFYFLLTFNDGSLKNLLLTKLSKLASKHINEFFRCFMLKNCAKTSFKLQLLKNRLSIDSINYFEYVKDNVFCVIMLPNKKILRKFNKTLLNVTIKCAEYIINYTEKPNVDLRYTILKLDNAGVGLQVDENLICAYIIFSKYSDRKAKSLKNICNHFNVTKEQVYSFVDYFKLEI